MLRPLTLAWVALGLALFFFPYFETWPGFSWFLTQLEDTTGINLTPFQMAMLGVWLVILTGLNLLTGYSGQISLGHSALVAAGAYIAAILIDRTGTPLAVAVLAGGLGAAAIGFGLGLPALRLTGPYLAIATLGLIISLPQLLKLDALSDWTGGATGLDLPLARAPSALDGLVDARQWLYYSIMLPAVIMTVLAWNITRSRVGRAFIALRDSEIGAQQMGVNVAFYKTLAFGLSALYAGVGGGLFVYAQDFASPESFSVFQSITLLVTIVLGGLASILGSVMAAAFFTFQAGVIARLTEVLPAVDRLRWAIYGVVLIVFMISVPAGAAGLIERVVRLRPRDVVDGLRNGLVAPVATFRAHPIVERLLGPAEHSPLSNGEDRKRG
ncbi:MAG: branched-chain amino acid ABC transporter permease [Dehalococcoidia bacterium]|nr:branched-chain amino acid ABC transporter permease [Dehalococcoidia bacterium]